MCIVSEALDMRAAVADWPRWVGAGGERYRSKDGSVAFVIDGDLDFV
jgi:hypothetical protein